MWINQNHNNARFVSKTSEEILRFLVDKIENAIEIDIEDKTPIFLSIITIVSGEALHLSSKNKEWLLNKFLENVRNHMDRLESKKDNKND